MKTLKIQKLLSSVVCAAFLSLVGAAASATTITWSGSSDFESEQISFTAFHANQLSAISSLDAYNLGGYAHTHNGAMAFSIKLNIDGVWTEVYSQTLNDYSAQYLAQISSPINFTGGMVSGLWLDSSPAQYNSYHGFMGCLDLNCNAFGANTAFEFNDVAAVPEPGSLALLGLGLLGVAARRRKQ